MNQNNSGATGVALLLASALVFGCGSPQQGQGQTPLTDEEASRLALQRVPGDVVRVEHEEEDGRAIIEVVVRDSQGQLQEVELDAQTGDVLEVEREENEGAEGDEDGEVDEHGAAAHDEDGEVDEHGEHAHDEDGEVDEHGEHAQDEDGEVDEHGGSAGAAQGTAPSGAP